MGPSHILNFVYGGGKFFFELITIIRLFGNIICQIVFDELFIIQKMKKNTRRIIRRSKRFSGKKSIRQRGIDIEELAGRMERLTIPSNAKQYPMTNEIISQFKRLNPRPQDCVINAMEIIGIMGNREAGVARSLVGINGITMEQIINIFNSVDMAYRHSFEIIYNLNKVMDEIRPGNAIFVGLGWIGINSGHVVILVKGLDNVRYVLDPQIPSLYPNAQRAGEFLYTFENYPLQQPSSIRVLCTDIDIEPSRGVEIEQ